MICRTIQRVEAIAGPLIGLKSEPEISEKEAVAIIVDCTEQPIYWPRDHIAQKVHYSENKKRCTLKMEYVIMKKGRIVIASPQPPRYGRP